MIHLEKNIVNTLQKAIFKDKTFCDLFTDYQPELFERTKDEQVFYVNQRYSEYESNKLVAMFERYKSFKPFRTKNYPKPTGLERVTFTGGFEIYLGKARIGWCDKHYSESKYKIWFHLTNKNICMKMVFSTTEDAKNWLKKEGIYLNIQMKYNLDLKDE